MSLVVFRRALVSQLFTLPERALPKLQQYQNPEKDFTVLAVSRDNTNLLGEGVLAVIDNQIDTTTGTIKLKATFANETLRLWPGQFVNTRLLLTTRKGSPVVPASVVQRGPDGAFAFVVQDDQTAAMRPLKVAQIESGMALIDEGLKPGERVVVDGQYKLQPGSHVQPAESPGGSPKAGPKRSVGSKNRSESKPHAALGPLQTIIGLRLALAPVVARASRLASSPCVGCTIRTGGTPVPLGIAVIGGLLVSQLLTLYTTPVIYLAIEKLRLRVAAWKRKLHGLGKGTVATAEASV